MTCAGRVFHVAIVLLALLSFGGAVAGAQPASDGAFLRVWERTDQPVADYRVNRTWIWGPHAASEMLMESYLESPGGERVVQYFEKSRMELTDPGAFNDGLWYVTNGLLVVELMTGRLQVGDAAFEDRAPADVPVAGDADDSGAPTYRSMARLRDAPALAVGEPIGQFIDDAGLVQPDDRLIAHGITAAAYVSETGHTVAGPFWELMHASAPVIEGGHLVNAALFQHPVYATGLPLTEAYWTSIKVAGSERDVLIQCFERRCLTYTPGNPPGWQVETANVGRHYYEWRYGTPLPAQPDPPPPGRILYRSDRSGSPDVFVINPDGTGEINLSDNPAWDFGAVWSPDGTRIAFASERDGNSEIYVVEADGSGLRNLTNSPTFETSPVWSPDGTQLLFQTDRDGNNIADELYLMEADGSNARLIDARAAGAAWSPDGRRIAFSSYDAEQSQIFLINPDGTGKTQLTDLDGSFGWLVWSPDPLPGSGQAPRIAFQLETNGNADIYTVSVVDGAVTRLTDDPGPDRQPSWSPDGRLIAFESERDGNVEVWMMHADGTHETNLTHDATADWCRPCSWSPDSRYLAFQSNRGSTFGGYDVFIVSVGARAVWRVTAVGDGSDSRWSP